MGISLWMDRKSVDVSQKSSLHHTSVPAGNFYLPMNDWQAIHVLPEGMVFGHPFIYWRSKQKNITHRVTVTAVEWGDEGISFCFICHTQENTMGPWAENNTCYCFVFATEARFRSSSDMATSWTTGNMTLQKTPLHQTAATLHEGVSCVWAHIHKQKRDTSVCFLLL